MNLNEEYARRIERLQTRLTEAELDGALYIYPIDIFYLTGTRQNSTLWVPQQGAPFLLVRKSFERACRDA